MHGTAVVDDDVTAQIRLFIIAFGEQLIGFRIDLPVDMPCGLPPIVDLVLGKLRGKAVEGATVPARDVTFDDLTGLEFKPLHTR